MSSSWFYNVDDIFGTKLSSFSCKRLRFLGTTINWKLSFWKLTVKAFSLMYLPLFWFKNEIWPNNI